jgi:hypothetical protein
MRQAQIREACSRKQVGVQTRKVCSGLARLHPYFAAKKENLKEKKSRFCFHPVKKGGGG